MAFAKTEYFPAEMIDMAAFAYALSHPARISILMYLLDHPATRCSEIVAHLPLSQPSCSRHLAELRKANLVTTESVGNEVRYTLRIERIKHFCDAFRSSLNPPDCSIN